MKIRFLKNNKGKLFIHHEDEDKLREILQSEYEKGNLIKRSGIDPEKGTTVIKYFLPHDENDQWDMYASYVAGANSWSGKFSDFEVDNVKQITEAAVVTV